MPAGSTSGLILRRIRPERNERRFYQIEVGTDLFGTILLRRRWGRIGTDGRWRADPYPSVSAALAALDALADRKRRRGYVSCRLPSPDTGDALTDDNGQPYHCVIAPDCRVHQEASSRRDPADTDTA